MAVDSGAEFTFVVVEMQGAEITCADYAVEILPCLAVTLLGAEVISGGICMAGVDADSYAVFVLYLVDDMGYMFEFVAEIGALSGSGFYHGSHADSDIEREVDAFGDGVEAFIYGNEVEMASRMEVEHSEAELLATAHFVEKRFARFQQFLGVGASEIYEEIVVG